MKKRFSDYVVALAVVACSVALLAALTAALTGWRLQKASRTLQIDYPDISGIHLHSELRYAGAPAGRVIAVRALAANERGADNPNAIRVTVEINDEMPALPADIAASISSDTLLSDKFVALSAGNPASGTLANNAILQGTPAAGLDTLLATAGPLLRRADAMLGELSTKLDDLLPKVSTLLVSTRDVMTEAHTLLARADKLIADNETNLRTSVEKLPALVTDLQEVERNANALLGHVDGFVGSTDTQLKAQLAELRVVLQNLKVVTTEAKAITHTLGEKPSRLIWGVGKPSKLTPEQTILNSREPLPALAR